MAPGETRPISVREKNPDDVWGKSVVREKPAKRRAKDIFFIDVSVIKRSTDTKLQNQTNIVSSFSR
ncbi:MAG: hypothetical protein HBSAPP04_09460 [Ignavibacteriaceae bacterium]|nr:MAG: hypothetical protein HBSAPP04_09460 [Ignavibacteriaceae bacterium]